MPLFAGYVFMFGTEADRVASLTTNRISRILPVHDGAGLCHDLEQIERLIASGAPVTVEERLCAGQAGPDPFGRVPGIGRHRAGTARRDAALRSGEFSEARGLDRNRRLSVGTDLGLTLEATGLRLQA